MGLQFQDLTRVTRSREPNPKLVQAEVSSLKKDLSLYSNPQVLKVTFFFYVELI